MIYLGAQKVGVSHRSGGGSTPIDGTVISDEKMAELQDAVAYRVGDYDDTRDVDEIIEELNKPYIRSVEMNMGTEPDSWIRPLEWPDLDSVIPDVNTDDYIYMTYYTKDSTFGGIALHVEKTTGGTAIQVAIGHILNGEYIIDSTITGTSNNYVYWFDGTEPDYIVVRVTGTIKVCYFYSVKDSNNATLHYRKQNVLERIAYVPHLTTFCTNNTSNAWTPIPLRREKVSNGDGLSLTSLYYAWAYGRCLKSLDISGLRTPNITNAAGAFYQNLELRTLDLKHLNVSKVINFNSMFSGNRNLLTIDLTGWNTESAGANMASMFDSCLSLKHIYGIENFKTANVTAMNNMFSNCYSLEELPIENWNVSKTTTIASMFNNCRLLIELDLSKWRTNLCTNFSSTFSNCWNLKRLNLTGMTHGVVTTVSSMFASCCSLQKIDISWLTITAACTNIYYMFNNCQALTELNFPVWDVSGLGNGNNTANSMFTHCYSLRKITGIKNWNFQLENSLANMFQNCYSLKDIDISGWNVSTATSLSNLFYCCYSLETINLSSWNPEKCTSFTNMFRDCQSLKTIGNIDNWDTSALNTADNMFYQCHSLISIPNITKWDMTNVTTIGSIFQSCHAVKEILLPGLNLPLCTNIQSTMRYCYRLEKVDLSNWNVPVAAYNATYYPQADNCMALHTVVGITVPSSYEKIGFTANDNLSHASVLTILNALPQVTGTHTVYLTAANVASLSATEKAIATNKGWTIAN